jgi:DNA-binding transcriptional ArsR family regulator
MLKYQPSALDDTFRALADPARRAIVERLGAGPASVSELAAPLPMSLPAVQQHLRILTDAGIVKSEKRGRVRWCRLEPRKVRAVETWAAARLRMWERRLDALGAHLEREKEQQK